MCYFVILGKTVAKGKKLPWFNRSKNSRLPWFLPTLLDGWRCGEMSEEGSSQENNYEQGEHSPHIFSASYLSQSPIYCSRFHIVKS